MGRLGRTYAPLLRSIPQSKKLDSLSAEAEILFYRLVAQVDDYGRMDGSMAYIAGNCVPRWIDSGRVDTAKLRVLLEELSKVGLVAWYESDGDDFLRLIGWHVAGASRANAHFPKPVQETATPPWHRTGTTTAPDWHQTGTDSVPSWHREQEQEHTASSRSGSERAREAASPIPEPDTDDPAHSIALAKLDEFRGACMSAGFDLDGSGLTDLATDALLHLAQKGCPPTTPKLGKVAAKAARRGADWLRDSLDLTIEHGQKNLLDVDDPRPGGGKPKAHPDDDPLAALKRQLEEDEARRAREKAAGKGY